MQAQEAGNMSLSTFHRNAAINKVAHRSPTSISSIDNIKMDYSSASADDDVDVMLKHEDFPKLLSLAIQIHKGHQQILAATGRPYSTQQELPNNRLTAEETLKATLNLQQNLLSNPGAGRTAVRRGDYPITDAIMDDSLQVLQRELNDIHRLLFGTEKPRKRGQKKEAIAIKYSKWQTDILMTWMIENKEEPFPDQAAIEYLMKRTGLSHSQIVNWTTNVRKRNRKATCQKGKKPHHYIDFLFLAQDRETRKKKNNSPTLQQPSPPPAMIYGEPELCRESPVFMRRSPLPDVQSFSGGVVINHECIHPSIFDDEPLDIGTVSSNDDDELMREFSEVWLADEDINGETLDLLGEVTLDDLLLFDNTTGTHNQDQILFPNVTDDSHEDDDDEEIAELRSSFKRARRTSSFDLDLVGEETMESWASQFGLSLED
jgi:hypothetical protein